MAELAIGAAGAAFLHVYFRALEVRWPEVYYGLSDITSYRLSLRLGAYIGFRFLPVVVVATAASALANSIDQSGIWSAMLLVSFHATLTAGRAAINAVRHRRVFGRRLLLAAHLGIFVAVLTAGVIGGTLGYLPQLQRLVPSVEGLRDNLWTAILAGVLGAYLVKVGAHSVILPRELIRKSSRRLPPGALEHADALSATNNADPLLVRALLLVENLQRPPWIRTIERTLGRFLPIGSYGVMQVQSERPISDFESIRTAVEQKLAGRTVPKRDGLIDGNALRRQIRSYNGNEQFVELVEAVYLELSYSDESRSSARGP